MLIVAFDGFSLKPTSFVELGRAERYFYKEPQCVDCRQNQQPVPVQDCPGGAMHMPAAEALLKEALLCCHHLGLNAYLAALLQVYLVGST